MWRDAAFYVNATLDELWSTDCFDFVGMSPPGSPTTGSSARPKSKMLFFVVGLPLASIILGATGCRDIAPTEGGSPNPEPPPASVSVTPSPITVAAGSTTVFTALFTPGLPGGGSLTWSVSPANGGTITSSGDYIASTTAGSYAIVATWTPSNPAAGTTISGSASVEVLSLPQPEAELNPDATMAPGANQASGTIRNAVIAGQAVPFVVSRDAEGDVQVSSGFPIPVMCKGCDATGP